MNSMDFKYKGEHSCDAAVLMCVDFRFTEYYLEGVRKTFNIETFDTWAVPGAAKNFVDPDNKAFAEALIAKIKQVSVGLHDIKQIIVLDHADCGAYGGRKAFESIESESHKHNEDLEATRAILKEHFPDQEIKIGIASLSEDETQVEIVEFT